MKDLDERSHLFTNVTITVTAVFVVMSLLVFIYKSMQCSETDSLGNDERLTEVMYDNRTADIGCITSDTTVALDYKIRNIGKDSLRVIFVSPDCHCTDYSLSKYKAGEGDSIVVSLKVNLRDKRKGHFLLNTVVGLNTRQRLYRMSVKGEVL